jgi:hypothetical protein
MQTFLVLFFAVCLFPFTSGSCALTGNQDVNVGIGVYIDQSGYCYPGQSFVAPGYSIWNVELLIGSGGWTVELRDGEFGSKVLGTSSTAVYNGYNVFSKVEFNPPVATIPGNIYTIYPRGNGQTWYINQNNYYASGRLAGTNPAGQCWGSNWDSAFHVNCGDSPISASTAWSCVAGIDCPIRMNSLGDIECMSTDGQNCLWTSGQCASTLASTPSSSIRPLTCGANHKNLYGITGYEDPVHWCFKGWESLKPWLCIPDITSPMRLNPLGNPECLSNNARDCLWGSVSCSSIQVYYPTTTPINPLVCGKMHQSTYGDTGYGNTLHWCYKTVKALEPVCMNTNNQVTFCSGSNCCGNFPCPVANT